MQRFFDIIFSGLSLLIFSPLLIPLMLLLRFTAEGEVFFLQSRVGKGGSSFYLYKFVTMLKDSPLMGTGTVTLHKDPRVLPLGHWLRATKINELPQLINIFFGTMSVIGPRPQTRRCFDVFPLEAQADIVRFRPGLSGIGSIVFRNEEKMMDSNSDPDKFYDSVIMPYKGDLERWYSCNYGISSYFLLIGLTVWVVIFSNTDIVWRIFKDLPRPPDELQEWI